VIPIGRRMIPSKNTYPKPPKPPKKEKKNKKIQKN
jgi:hypothetical protein